MEECNTSKDNVVLGKNTLLRRCLTVRKYVPEITHVQESKKDKKKEKKVQENCLLALHRRCFQPSK